MQTMKVMLEFDLARLALLTDAERSVVLAGEMVAVLRAVEEAMKQAERRAC